MARKFVSDDVKIQGNIIEVGGSEAKHIHVLRHKIGDEICVNELMCEILSIDKNCVRAQIVGQAEKTGVPDVKIILCQALLKSDKMEYVIQKSVELGAHKIVPFFSNNVVVKLDEKDKIKKLERWNKISLEASKQCGRSDIVKVNNICNFNKLIEELNGYEKVIIAYENENTSLKSVIKDIGKAKNIAVIIGAEGGFEKNEVDKILHNKNAVSVSLGERILRAETASLNLLSILEYELNN